MAAALDVESGAAVPTLRHRQPRTPGRPVANYAEVRLALAGGPRERYLDPA
ncbi:MAG: hypothetical protein M3Q43_10015 [Actinomycetota bacterium]|nr:hypothetical protein [Actinomycetota bacterium]